MKVRVWSTFSIKIIDTPENYPAHRLTLGSNSWCRSRLTLSSKLLMPPLHNGINSDAHFSFGWVTSYILIPNPCGNIVQSLANTKPVRSQHVRTYSPGVEPLYNQSPGTGNFFLFKERFRYNRVLLDEYRKYVKPTAKFVMMRIRYTVKLASNGFQGNAQKAR